jgi:hypothetical protein
MIEPRRAVPVALLVILIVAGCGGATASAVPTDGTSPTAAPASTGPAGSAAPEPSAAAIDPVTPTACLSLGAEDCQRALGMAATVLTSSDPAPIYVQVGSFFCAAGERCATTLLARPEGDVLIEFGDGTGINVHLKVAADGTFATTRDEGFFISVEPSSAPGLAVGATPYTLGHCGIFSGIDHGGTWWDPVGPVDADHTDAINSAAGTLTVTDPLHAAFVTPAGFSVQLLRRVGPKLLPGCM